MDQIKLMLVNTLYRVLGNKSYLRDIEKLIERMDLTPQERQSLQYLSNDLTDLKRQASESKKFF